MTTNQAAPPSTPTVPGAGSSALLPRAGSRIGSAPLRGDNARLVQVGLFVAGVSLMPIGIIVICLGWYGIANTPYEYDQLVYIVSGGLLGLGITFIGGFLYFAAWIARVGNDLKDSDKRLSDTLLVLADTVSHPSEAPPGAPSRR